MRPGIMGMPAGIGIGIDMLIDIESCTELDGAFLPPRVDFAFVESGFIPAMPGIPGMAGGGFVGCCDVVRFDMTTSNAAAIIVVRTTEITAALRGTAGA